MKTKTKVVIALDSFKGALSSAEAGEAVRNGILRRLPQCETQVFPLGDGGRGLHTLLLNVSAMKNIMQM